MRIRLLVETPGSRFPLLREGELSASQWLGLRTQALADLPEEVMEEEEY
jgi:hypothetical protein